MTAAIFKIPDSAVSDNYGKKSQMWNNFSKISNLPTLNDEIRKEKSRKNWESNTNSSTLSLYITAHENSSEAVTSDSFHNNENSLKNNKFGLIKRHEILDTSTFFIQNPHEFPRQQNYEVPEPETCQYKASQRLLNPNEASMIVQQAGTVTEIWMFFWLLIFVISTGVFISITCNKSRQPPQRKKYSNAESMKSKKNKDEKKDGENNKNNNIEKSRKTVPSKPKQPQSEKSSSQTTGDKSDSKAEADFQQQKSEKQSKKDKSNKRVIQKNENLSPPQPPQQVKEQKIENTDVDVEPKNEVKVSKDVITKEPDDVPNKDDNEIAKASSNKESKKRKKKKKSAKESDEDEENDDSSKKFKKKKHKKKKNESGDEDDENHSRKKKKSKKLKKKKSKKEDESQKPGESQKSSEELYTALSPIKSPKRPKDEDKIPGTMTRYNNLLIDGYSDEVPSKFKRFLKPPTPNIQAQPSSPSPSPIERMPLDKTQQNQCYEEEPIPIKKSKKKALARKKKVVGNEADPGKYIDEEEEASASNKKKKLNKKKSPAESKLGDKKEEDERIQKLRAKKRKQQNINTFDEKIAKGEIIEYNNEYPPTNDVMPVSDKAITGSSSTDCEPKVKSEPSSSRTTTIKASQNRGIDDLIDVSLATNETNHGTQLIQNVHLDLHRKQPPPPPTNTTTTTKTKETHSTSKDRTSDDL